jgi:hypothetical protein
MSNKIVGNKRQVELFARQSGQWTRPVRLKHLKISKGSFSKVEGRKKWEAVLWHHCREWFLDDSIGTTRLLYTHDPHKTENLARFIRKVENKLKIEEKSQIGTTQSPTVSWMKISPFWTGSMMRRSFLTMMLRCGSKYCFYKNNFSESLFSIRYSKFTEYAVRRFLSGHTKYCGRKRGWYSEFKNKTNEQVDSLLILP